MSRARGALADCFDGKKACKQPYFARLTGRSYRLSTHHTSFDEPAGGGLWPSLNRFLAVLIAVTMLAAVTYRYMPELGKRRPLESRIEQLTLEIAQQKQMLARHTLEENLLKRDAEYVGLVARDRLDLMKEGETIYRVEPSRPDPAKMRLNSR